MKKSINIMKLIKNILMVCVFVLLLSTASVYADTTWQSDWTYSTNTTDKTITLTKYNGSEESYKVPSKATISGVEYSVIFGNGAGKTSAIKNLSFQEGVKVTATSSLFSGNTKIEKVDFKGANTSAATSFYYMFQGCTSLKEVNMTDIDTSKVTSLYYTFSGATNLQKVVMSGLDLSKVSSVTCMFRYATNLEEVDFSNTDMSKITTFKGSNPAGSTSSSIASPFYGAPKLKKINMRNFNTASLTTAQSMFRINYRDYNELIDLDITNWNTENVTNFEDTFENCANLTTIKGIGTLNTSSATSFWLMFSDCEKLESLPGIENWDTSNVTNMSSMFSGALSIDNLDFSGWDTSNVTKINSMFIGAEKLKNINVSTWNTSKVTNMQEVFKGCASLEVLDLSGWTTESIENTAHSHMSEMFGKDNGGNSADYEPTPLKEITLNKEFKFKTYNSPGLPGGYWHLKEGTEEEKKPKFTPARLYQSYNNGITPTEGYSHKHTYVLATLDPADAEYYAQGWGDNNAWEVHYPQDKFKAYCINLHRGSPSGYYDRTLVSENSIIDLGFLDSDNYGYEPLGSNMEEALITLIYYGYGNDGAGIQDKYGLSDSEFLLLTQQAIWNFTDRYNNKAENFGEKTKPAYDELISKRFSDIPNNENLKLYLYESIDGKQNLLSISGLSDVAHAGVRVLKLAPATDGSLEPLIGAEFDIYDSDNNVVATIKSDENGYATKYNVDSIYGLPEGIYTIRESKAPRGYTKTNTYYKFIVRKEDDNEIITVGKLSGSGDDTAMIFENGVNTSVQGGGLIIKVVDQKNNPIKSGATFEILDENGRVIDTITTDGNGSYKTGKKDLDLNKKYTARLKNAPKGYITTVEIQDETLTENEKYKTLVFKFIAKTCKVEIEATKKYNAKLSTGLFNFELYNTNDKKTFKSANDKNGNIKFTLEYDANDLGYQVYSLKETVGTLKDVTYDKHSEEVIVNVEDEGKDSLTCKVQYQNEKPTFTNKYTGDCPTCEQKEQNQNSGPKTGIVSDVTTYITLLLLVFIPTDALLITKYKKLKNE